MNNYYNISFYRLVLLLLPTMLRQNIVVAFIAALVKPVALIHRQLEVYRSQVDIAVNSQVCYLQALLNDSYDYYNRRIVVRDAPVDYNDFFLFSEGSGNAVMLSEDASLWVDAGKLGTTVPDFEIVFPKGYTLSEEENKAVRQLINNNKLTSKKYAIVYE